MLGNRFGRWFWRSPHRSFFRLRLLRRRAFLLHRSRLARLFGAQCGGALRGRCSTRLCAARSTRLEFETDRAVGLADQEGRELAPRPIRHEPTQQVGAALAEQLAHLVGVDLLLQDHLAGAKIATALGADAPFADIGHRLLENIRAALRTWADGCLATE